MIKTTVSLDDYQQFDVLIDVRSPAEFAHDHIPGAINCPVLNDEQRAIVGTIYKQQSAFEARKIGGAWVADNIARHLQTDVFRQQPQSWRPLVYCWRGGMRSGSFVNWLRLVGWHAQQLAGGYKGWRKRVVEQLTQLPRQFDFRVLCGPTGSAKTRVLQALHQQGAQVLDLEALACHKGSVLGALPDYPEQPSQKAFETSLYHTLAGFNPQQPVFVEAESRKIGQCHIPCDLIDQIRHSPCLILTPSREARLDYLCQEYAYLGDDTALLQCQIQRLKGLHSNTTLAAWQALAAQKALKPLFTALIDEHYDPLYQRSQHRNFAQLATAPQYCPSELSEHAIAHVANQILNSQHDDPAEQH